MPVVLRDDAMVKLKLDPVLDEADVFGCFASAGLGIEFAPLLDRREAGVVMLVFPIWSLIRDFRMSKFVSR